MINFEHWELNVDENNIAWLIMDVKGSSANILNRPVLEELDTIIKEIEQKDNLSGFCLLSGKKGGFVYGADINEFATLNNIDEAKNLLVMHKVFFKELKI